MKNEKCRLLAAHLIYFQIISVAWIKIGVLDVTISYLYIHENKTMPKDQLCAVH